ncbi:MAG: cation-translocating P-type ATPase [Candidatus Levybacteria bacterium]|nr:cation-translocating P-type ATPase [Candidatus Levybacteria bacterium]
MKLGLTSKLAEEKLKTFGRNEIITKKPFSALSLFLSQFPSFINTLLAIAAIFSFLIKDALDGIIILAILLLNGIFGFIQEYRAEKSLEKLKNLVKPVSRVIRDGKEIEVETETLVPGDVVVLSEGDRISADGTLTLGRHLEIDESILTGESLPVAKKQNDSLLKGTLVVKGKGHLLIEKTGMTTQFGQIAQSLSEIEADKTPLQKQLDSLGKMISVFAITASFLLIPIGIMQGKEIAPIVLLAISIAIAAVPEGLPAVVTIALAIGTNRMAKKHAIIRKTPSVETLGTIQIILLDKTGTLTQNSMRVKKVYLREKKAENDIMRACVLGNTASLVEKEGEENYDILGDKTDGALLLWAKERVKDLSVLKDEGKIVDEYVFDPETKTVTTVWKSDGKSSVYVRGAPETILKKSNLTETEKEAITSHFQAMAKEGLRIIGFGSKILSSNDKKAREKLEIDLDFLGFVGIYDPPRKEAKQAVLEAKKAGIKPVMVTGDNELTALAIAKEIGLIEKNEDVVTGEELKKINDEELEKLILKTRIFARTRPEDKLRLVSLFKKKGFIVGVTGDGVNDALALKRADVGVAMGETGTEVAKEASDIVLIDDNFATLVHAVEEGRVIYNNILKAITYLLSGNLAELSLVFAAAVLGMPPPLLPTQILWINLVTDGIPALALASDTKDPNVLAHAPRDPKTPILTKGRVIFIGIVGFGLAGFLLVIFSLLLKTQTEIFSRTITFNLLIFFHLMIAFVVRGQSLFRANRFLLLGVLATLVLQVLITTLPFFQTIFHLGFN